MTNADSPITVGDPQGENMVMPFGKYKGKTIQWIADNDVLYLDWMMGIDLRGRLFHAVYDLHTKYEEEIAKKIDEKDPRDDFGYGDY